jgi:AcrR family transcriptional regulator
MTPEPARQRLTAGERREQIVAVALRHFAVGGLHGTSTEDIAAETGLSQPYLFRLFRTKRELFLACADRACRHVGDVFRRVAAEVPPEQRLERMGRAYVDELLPERHENLMLMQAFAAGSDPAIQAHVRAAYGELVKEVAALAGVPPGETFTFFAHGMLLNVIAALDIPAIAGTDEWAAQWIDLKDGA